MTSVVEDVVSGDDAAVILHYKDRLLPGSLVNICGQVSAVSEVFKVKNNLLFIIELEKVFIVVMQEKFLLWQPQIFPQQKCVFTKLRPTTLHKGIAVPTRVFVPWIDSELYHAEKVNSNIIPVQDWLMKYTDLRQETEDKGSTETKLKTAENGIQLVSYQGTVTGTANSRYGVYELDNKIRLHVSSIPASHKFNFFKVGTQITVYNAHQEDSSKESQIHLQCSIKSCIKVVKECTDPASSFTKVSQFSPSSPVVQIIVKYGLNGSEINSLLNMIQRINNKTKDNRQTEDVIFQIISSFCYMEKLTSRNLVAEFLSAPHHCLITELESSSRRIPMLQQIRKLIHSAKSLETNPDTLNSMYSSEEVSEHTYSKQHSWSYLPQVIGKNPQQILVGLFEFSPDSGHLTLSDDTGRMDIVVCPQVSHKHTCDESCLQISPGKPIACPRAQPGLNKCFVGVNKGEIITEKIVSEYSGAVCEPETELGRVEVSTPQSNYVIYLQLCLTDCTVLATPVKSNVKTKLSPNLLKTDDGEGLGVSGKEFSERNSQLVYVTHLESLMVKSFSSGVSLGFSLLGYFVDESELTESFLRQEKVKIITHGCDLAGSEIKNRISANEPSRSETKRRISLDEPSSCETKSRISANEPYNSEMAKELPSTENSNRTSDCEPFNPKIPQRISDDGGKNSVCDVRTEHKFKPVVLVFSGKSVRWYDSLETETFYRLRAETNKPVFKATNFYEAKIKKAVEFSKARMCFEADEDINIEKVILKEFSKEIRQKFEPAPFVTVKEILAESFSGTLVSIKGTILSRKHLPDTKVFKMSSSDELESRNKTSSISVMYGTSLCVQVGDSQTSSVCVYMNLTNLSYPVGLVPGAGVMFTRLERHLSAAGTVYCLFIPVSTVSVFKICSDTPSLLSQPALHTFKDEVLISKPLFLADLYNNSTPGHFQVNCHICTFMKLSLRMVPTGYNSSSTLKACASSISSSAVSAQASVLVDDGSASAVVSFRSADLVRRLLCLSCEEWQDLQTVLQQQGEIFVNQFSGYNQVDSPVKSFLMLLCDSFQVKRCVYMRVKRGSMNINNLTIDEFLLKTITTGLATFETRCHPYLQLECLNIEEEKLDHIIF